MASIEFIRQRVDGKNKEIAKLEKKLERIRKAEASGWENNPYYYSESDLKWTIRDLESAKEGLAKWEAELAIANEKAASRDVPAILEFLEIWKTNCYVYYHNGLVEYYKEREELRRLCREYESAEWGTPEYEEAKKRHEDAYKVFHTKCVGRFEEWKEERNGRWYSGRTKVKDGEYEYLDPYDRESTLEEAEARLMKDLNDEANRKYDFIIERTNAIVGKITDASELHVGAKQDLNGYIKGEKGTAKVQTIGAGGYNIQCFHFRTLINKA